MNGDSITIAGIVFVAYAFVMIILAFALADPLDQIVAAIGGADVPYANEAMDTFIPMYRAAIKMALLLGMATPFVVFIMWIYNREPVQGY